MIIWEFLHPIYFPIMYISGTRTEISVQVPETIIGYPTTRDTRHSLIVWSIFLYKICPGFYLNSSWRETEKNIDIRLSEFSHVKQRLFVYVIVRTTLNSITVISGQLMRCSLYSYQCSRLSKKKIILARTLQIYWPSRKLTGPTSKI